MEKNKVSNEVKESEKSIEQWRSDFAREIVIEFAKKLQKYVYIREEGDSENFDDAIVYAPFKSLNQDLVGIAKKYGITGFIEESEGVEKLQD